MAQRGAFASTPIDMYGQASIDEEGDGIICIILIPTPVDKYLWENSV